MSEGRPPTAREVYLARYLPPAARKGGAELVVHGEGGDLREAGGSQKGRLCSIKGRIRVERFECWVRKN